MSINTLERMFFKMNYKTMYYLSKLVKSLIQLRQFFRNSIHLIYMVFSLKSINIILFYIYFVKKKNKKVNKND